MLYYDYDDNKETPQNPILIIKAPTLRFRLSDFKAWARPEGAGVGS